MTKTPITDAAAFLVRWNERLAAYTTSKPNYDGGEVVEAERMRSLETAAQGLRERFQRVGIAIREMQKDARTDYTLSSLAALDFKFIVAQLDGSDEALARFDALKEVK